MEYISLTEHQSEKLEANALSEREAEIIRQRYDTHLDLTYPSPATDNKWLLEPRGSVGILPLIEGRALHISPKGPIRNIFRMLDVIGSLPEMPEGFARAGTVPDVTQQLIRMLAEQVQNRARRGLHREYTPQKQDLSYVRGTIDVEEHIRRPHRTKVPCHFDEHETDIEANRILAWTLYKVVRSGLCDGKTQQAAERAFKSLSGRVSLSPVRPEDCTGRYYSRLTEDYRPMHGVCYLLLRHVGLGHETGEQAALPFIVDMPSVFEEYVVEVLRRRPGSNLRVDSDVVFEYDGGRFEMDAVLYDEEKEKPVSVIEVKYKYPNQPSSEDVQQAVSYATALNCRSAAMVYPKVPGREVDTKIGNVGVHTISISLEHPLEETYVNVEEVQDSNAA